MQVAIEGMSKEEFDELVRIVQLSYWRYKEAIMCCKEALKLDISDNAKKEIQDRIKSLKNKLRDERWYNRLYRWLK